MARGRPRKCPYCRIAGQLIRKGYRQTATLGQRQIYFCKHCGRKHSALISN